MLSSRSQKKNSVFGMDENKDGSENGKNGKACCGTSCGG